MLNKLNTTGVCLMIPRKTPFSRLHPKSPSPKKEALLLWKARTKLWARFGRKKRAAMMRIYIHHWEVWIQKEPFRQCPRTEGKERRSKTLLSLTGQSTTRGRIKYTKAKSTITVRIASSKITKQVSLKNQTFLRKATKSQKIYKQLSKML